MNATKQDQMQSMPNIQLPVCKHRLCFSTQGLHSPITVVHGVVTCAIIPLCCTRPGILQRDSEAQNPLRAPSSPPPCFSPPVPEWKEGTECHSFSFTLSLQSDTESSDWIKSSKQGGRDMWLQRGPLKHGFKWFVPPTFANTNDRFR